MRSQFRTSRTAAAIALALVVLAAHASGADPIRLRAAEFDPSSNVFLQDVSPDGYWLVQFDQNVGEADRVIILRSGASIISYIPEKAFLIAASANAINNIRLNNRVSWVGAYRPEFRVAPEIDPSSPEAPISVLVFAGEDSTRIADEISDRGGSIRSVGSTKEGGIIIVDADGITARSFGFIAGVRWVEPYIAPKLTNNVGRALMNAPAAWGPEGLYGSGQVVAVADTGLDVGAFSPSLHADFAGKVIAAFALGRPGLTNDPHGHGTHVSGSVLGSGIASGANPEADQYEGSFAGVAPRAQLVMQSIIDYYGGLQGLPDDLGTLFGQAYASGARIHSNSWGSNVSGSYDVQASQLDTYAWQHPDMVILFAAGNEGIDADFNGIIDLDSVNSPGTAKNCITVGASESLRASGGYEYGWGSGSWASDFPVEPIKSDLVSDDPNGMAAFSSRGPCKDGRIKPDIVAPGTNIISCRSHDPAADAGWGAYNSDYVYSGGTSMSTPLTAGAAALVREYYQDRLGMDPSAALVKATLLCSGQDLAPGQYGIEEYLEIAERPNNVEGWGLVDLQAALVPDVPLSRQQIDEKTGLSTGQMAAYSFHVADGTVPLRVQLVWTDYPGDPSAGKALVNDLDLTVQVPGGAILNGNGALDRVNNVEGVAIPSPASGNYTIQVSAFNVPHGPQPFALVVLGGLPRSFIKGRATSAGGAGIPGVSITAEGPEGSYQGITASDGQYLINLPAGEYTASAARTGWSFDPPASAVTVPGVGVTGVDFQGSASSAKIRGHVYAPQYEEIMGVFESPHYPYGDNQSLSTEVQGPSDAVRIRVHFSRLETEEGVDFVFVRSSAGATVSQNTGGMEDFWSPWVDGNSLTIALETDDSQSHYYGWMVDRYAIQKAGAPLPGILVHNSHTNQYVISNDEGHYEFAGIEPLPTTISVVGEEQIIKPARRDIWPEPGETVVGQDFVALPEPPLLRLVIHHDFVGDLRVTVGVGDPASPAWSQVVANRQGGNSNTLDLEIPLDDALPHLPPSWQNRWFIAAEDKAGWDSGSFISASVSRAGWTWPATSVPTPIPDQATGILYIPSELPDTVGGAKSKVDGMPVLLWNAVVSARFSNRIYVQDPLYSSGLCVMGSFNVVPGDRVVVHGYLETLGCERNLNGARIWVVHSGDPSPRALQMKGRAVGGEPPNLFSPGFEDTEDLTNLGLLVGLAGRVTKTGANWFYLWDGTNIIDASGFPGTRISAPGMPIPSSGSAVTVRGISSCLDAGYGSARIIYVRDPLDIQVWQSGQPVFTDNFETGLGAWYAAGGTTMPTTTSAISRSPSKSLLVGPSSASAIVHDLDGYYSNYAGVSVWFYDSGVGAMSHQVELRSIVEGELRDRFAIGVNPAASTTKYSVYTLSGGWSATSTTRSPGWRKLGIRINSYRGLPSDVSFMLDGAEIATGVRVSGLGVSQIVVGSPDGPAGSEGYYDDVQFGHAE